MLQIIHADWVGADEHSNRNSLEISDGKFVILHSPAQVETIDFAGDVCCPAFIDLQVYGGGGILFSDAPGASVLEHMYQNFAHAGCTCFLPTIATNSPEIIFKSIDAVREYQNQGKPGVPGLHLEGPFINHEKRGAHIPGFISPASQDFIKKITEYGQGVIKMMTIAPELVDEKTIDFLHSHHIKLSAGHTAATFQQANEAFANGLSIVTHLYNAMEPMHHRLPGLLAATMLHENVMASIVADGFHVDFNMVRLAKKMMAERLFLITDAVAPSTGVYPHQLSGNRYILPDGTLSGSALSMHKAVMNLVDECGIELKEALRMATYYPAKAAGISEYGNFANGSYADFLRLGQDGTLKEVYVKGKVLKPSL